MTVPSDQSPRTLTPEQEALRAAISLARQKMDEANRAYHEAESRCTHVFREVHGDAVCAICDGNAGYWCPKSPTHLCDYDRSGICIHCGEPDERK